MSNANLITVIKRLTEVYSDLDDADSYANYHHDCVACRKAPYTDMMKSAKDNIEDMIAYLTVKLKETRE